LAGSSFKHNIPSKQYIIKKRNCTGFSACCYIQGYEKIRIGNYTLIGSNVGINNANHDVMDYRNHIIGAVVIGDCCWIGMNSVILPNILWGQSEV
jgi:acetyltransferase-like isoleucine patch superfamily enzyme